MQKPSPMARIANTSELFSRLSRKKDGLLDSLIPGWIGNKIENLLFIHVSKDAKARESKGIRQFDIKTNGGNIRAYETGSGPAVVFVHGWGGSASQFFPLMRGLEKCGFRAVSFDHLGHGSSDRKSAKLHKTIAATNQVLEKARQGKGGLCAIVGHSTGCIDIAAARNALVRDLPLLLISPVFDYRRFFLRKLVNLSLDSDIVRQYGNSFAKTYSKDYQQLELARNLDKYAEHTIIAHDETDAESPIKDSVRFCKKYPATRLVTTKHCDHVVIVNCETVWQELKTHLGYDDAPGEISSEIVYQ